MVLYGHIHWLCTAVNTHMDFICTILYSLYIWVLYNLYVAHSVGIKAGPLQSHYVCLLQQWAAYTVLVSCIPNKNQENLVSFGMLMMSCMYWRAINWGKHQSWICMCVTCEVIVIAFFYFIGISTLFCSSKMLLWWLVHDLNHTVLPWDYPNKEMVYLQGTMWKDGNTRT